MKHCPPRPVLLHCMQYESFPSQVPYSQLQLFRLMKQLGNYDLFINTTQKVFQENIMLHIEGKALVKMIKCYSSHNYLMCSSLFQQIQLPSILFVTFTFHKHESIANINLNFGVRKILCTKLNKGVFSLHFFLVFIISQFEALSKV